MVIVEPSALADTVTPPFFSPSAFVTAPLISDSTFATRPSALNTRPSPRTNVVATNAMARTIMLTPAKRGKFFMAFLPSFLQHYHCAGVGALPVSGRLEYLDYPVARFLCRRR